MLIDHLEAGGAERFCAGLATALAAERFDVCLCTTRFARGPLLDQLAAAGVRHVGIRRAGRFDLLALGRLARAIRAESPQVLHAHKFGSNVWGAVLGRLLRVPVVVAHEQTWSYRGQPLRRFLDGQLIGRLATAFVAVSGADRRRMVEWESVPAGKVVQIPNAYVPRDNDDGDGDLRRELGISAEAPVVGTAAVLRPQKALEVLLEAFARLPTAAHLLIAGDGPCRGRLEEHAERLGLSGRAHFIGRRDRVTTVLDAVDVAAMSSDFEGTPLFAFECMAHGTPLVCTSVGGLPEVLADGVSARLVPPRDPAAMASAIGELLANPALRSSLAAAARERVEDFTIERVAGRFADLYERLLADQPPDRPPPRGRGRAEDSLTRRLS